MPIVSDSERRNAFSQRLKDEPKQSPELEPEMSSDQMKVTEIALENAEKACHEASRCLLNLSLAITTPSQEQADISADV
jgi:hypothetical protein